MTFTTIVIGDELLIGQVADTNSGFFARHLAPYGWQARQVITVADNARQIGQALNQALEQTPVVLITGGLGPTKDDITKNTLCHFFGGTLRHDPETEANVRAIVAGRGLKLNEYTLSQAMVPTSCRVIQNRCGTAPIMWFERDGKVVVSMPGVPYEAETMFTAEVLPRLIRHFHRDMAIAFRHCVVVGIIESALAMRLDEFERNLPEHIHLAYLPQPGWIKLRLTGNHPDASALDAEMTHLNDVLHDLLGDLIVADNDLTLSAVVGEILRRRNLTLATAESCTGGNIAREITRIAGSSDYFIGSVVSYNRRVKESVLGVPAEIIDRENVVSEPVARLMAEGVAQYLNTDCAVATTGVAGPSGGTPDIPIGTVWIAARVGNRTITQCRHIPGHRERVIARATNDALLLLLNLLTHNDS